MSRPRPHWDSCRRRHFLRRLAVLVAPLAGAGCTPWVDKSWADKESNLKESTRARPAPEADTADRQLRMPDGATMTLIRVPAGQFLMGSAAGEPERAPDERQHRVILTHPFWLGRTEVTQRQWSAVMNRTLRDQHAFAQAGRRDGAESGQPPPVEGPEHPIHHVSWDEATDFCRRINERESADGRIPAGYGYWLPTEAQWEYACRAGSDGPFAAGGTLDELTWYERTAGAVAHPVATKAANAWKVHDMHGNVSEWCADYYGEYPDASVIDPLGPESGAYRVARGGRFADSAPLCRSARRSGVPGNRRYEGLGFRIALRRMSR
jgi:formylglycine-generating enzyme required for sulfatase activity